MVAVISSLGFQSEPAWFELPPPDCEFADGHKTRYSIRDVLREIPDLPCVTCEHSSRCAAERLACSGFVAYVEAAKGVRGDERPSTPRRDPYARVFPG